MSSTVPFPAPAYLPSPGAAGPWRTYTGLAIVAAVAVIALFFNTGRSMFDIWWRSETFAHGLLVVPICVWLIYRLRHELAHLTPRPAPWVLMGVVVFSLTWWLMHLADILVLEQIAMVGVLVCALWAVLGHTVTRALLFPLGFLFLAVPMGEALIPPLMDFTANFTVAALQLVGMPVYREGLFFEIPSGRWSVVEGCSGLRYLIASMTLGLLYAYLTYRSPWRRLAFVAAAIIVPIFANGLRAFMIVMIGHLSGMKLAMGVDHYIYGWVFFGFVMLLLFWVGGIWREDTAHPAPQALPAPATTAPPAPRALVFVTAVLVLAAVGPLLDLWSRSRSEPPAPVALTIPHAAPGWSTTPAQWDWQPRFVGASAQIRGDYHQDGVTVGVAITYYQHQSQDAELVNSRNVMVPEKDPLWGNIGEQRMTIHLNGQPFDIRQTRLKSAQQTLLVWDFYWLDGQYTADPLRAKLLEAQAKLMGAHRPAADVVIATPYEDRVEPAAAVLQNFLEQMMPNIEASLRRTP